MDSFSTRRNGMFAAAECVPGGFRTAAWLMLVIDSAYKLLSWKDKLSQKEHGGWNPRFPILLGWGFRGKPGSFGEASLSGEMRTKPGSFVEASHFPLKNQIESQETQIETRQGCGYIRGTRLMLDLTWRWHSNWSEGMTVLCLKDLEDSRVFFVFSGECLTSYSGQILGSFGGAAQKRSFAFIRRFINLRFCCFFFLCTSARVVKSKTFGMHGRSACRNMSKQEADPV